MQVTNTYVSLTSYLVMLLLPCMIDVARLMSNDAWSNFNQMHQWNVSSWNATLFIYGHHV